MKTPVLLSAVLALAGACSSSTADRPGANAEREGWIDRDRERAQEEKRGVDVAEGDMANQNVEATNERSTQGDGIDGIDDTETSNAAVVSDQTAEHDVAKHEADNTGRNARDDQPGKLTALDQSNSKSDVDITQAIRKKVMADDALSFNAKNVKIITVSGKVTLRGPVENARESAAIEKSARAVTGVVQVDNQIEVER